MKNFGDLSQNLNALDSEKAMTNVNDTILEMADLCIKHCNECFDSAKCCGDKQCYSANPEKGKPGHCLLPDLDDPQEDRDCHFVLSEEDAVATGNSEIDQITINSNFQKKNEQNFEF